MYIAYKDRIMENVFFSVVEIMVIKLNLKKYFMPGVVAYAFNAST